MTGITDPDERRIAEAIVEEALARGCYVGVNNGGYDFEILSNAKEKILEAMGHTAEESLVFYRNKKRIGFATLIWGLGSCTLADYSDNEWTRAILDRAQRIQDEMDERDET